MFSFFFLYFYINLLYNIGGEDRGYL